jgi:MFS transporter, FHS family, glucose/mannose:H+ symporter
MRRKVGRFMITAESPTDDVRAKRVANSVIHSGFVLAGAVTVLLGPILPILIARWSMSDERAGLFFTSQFCGNLAGIASLGYLISRRGYPHTFSIGFTSIALGIVALEAGNETTGLLATAVYGYGLGLILSGANLWVAEVAASRRAAALSVLNLAWGVGAIACPALVMLAARSHRLAVLLFGIAGCSVFLALALASMDLDPPSQGAAGASPSQAEPTVGIRAACALGGLFFLYVGAESSMGGWAAALARRLGTRPGNPWELAPMFFWAGLLAGRALGPLALRRMTERAMLTAGLVFAGVWNGALLWVATFRGAAICLVAIGLGFACIYPLLVALMVGHYGKRASRAGSIVFSLASLGGATMPWLVGFTSTHAGSLRAGLMVPLAGCLVMISLLGLSRDQSLA